MCVLRKTTPPFANFLVAGKKTFPYQVENNKGDIVSRFLRSLMVFAGLIGASGILLLANSSSAQASTIYTWDVVLGEDSDHICCGADHERYATSADTFPVGTVLTLVSVSLEGDTTACASEGWNATVKFPYDKDAEAASVPFNGPGFDRPTIFLEQ